MRRKFGGAGGRPRVPAGEGGSGGLAAPSQGVRPQDSPHPDVRLGAPPARETGPWSPAPPRCPPRPGTEGAHSAARALQDLGLCLRRAGVWGAGLRGARAPTASWGPAPPPPPPPGRLGLCPERPWAHPTPPRLRETRGGCPAVELGLTFPLSRMEQPSLPSIVIPCRSPEAQLSPPSAQTPSCDDRGGDHLQSQPGPRVKSTLVSDWKQAAPLRAHTSQRGLEVPL